MNDEEVLGDTRVGLAVTHAVIDRVVEGVCVVGPGRSWSPGVNEERGDYIGSHKVVKSYIRFISDDQFAIDNLFGLDLS